MGTKTRFVARNGINGNGFTITNIADPVNAQDASTKAFSTNASNLNTGTISASILGNSSLYLGTTQIALNRASSVISLTGITSIDGNAATATKLATSRSISITGDITYTVNFDGSNNVTAAATLSATGVTASTYGSSTQVPIITVDGKGRITGVVNSTNITAVNIGAGTAGAIPYQTSANNTGFVSVGTSGQILLSNGTGAPTWISQSSLNVGSALSAGVSAQSTIVSDNATVGSVFPLWVTGGANGNYPIYSSNTKFSFVPNTGTLTATAFSGNGSALTNVNAVTLGGKALGSGGTGPTWGSVPYVNTDGTMEIGRYLDFHNASADGIDYSVRLETGGTANSLTINGSTIWTAGNNPNAKNYDIQNFINGKPLAGEVLVRLICLRAFTIAANCAGSYAFCSISATSTFTINILKNGGVAGTLVFSSGSTQGTFTMSSALTLNPGDQFVLQCTGSQDASLSDIAIAIAGNLV